MKTTLTTLFLALFIALVAAPGCGSSNEQVHNAPVPDAGEAGDAGAKSDAEAGTGDADADAGETASDAGNDAANTSDSEADTGSDATGDSDAPTGDDGAAQDAANG